MPILPEVKTAALLAQEGYLTSIDWLRIENINISDIPNNHIVKLASIVTEGVIIYNMIHAKQLASILVSIKVKCPGLRLDNMQLSLADTRSLVISMRNRVEDVLLYDVAVVIESLCDYDGRGHCTMLRVWGLTRLKHADRLRRWTTDVGWTVKRDDDECLWLQRK